MDQDAILDTTEIDVRPEITDTELLPAEDEVTARVREALLADAATSGFAEDLQIDTVGGRVYLRGIVDDVEDTDNAAAVAAEVAGVVDVIDELEVRAGLSEQ